MDFNIYWTLINQTIKNQETVLMNEQINKKLSFISGHHHQGKSYGSWENGKIFQPLRLDCAELKKKFKTLV